MIERMMKKKCRNRIILLASAVLCLMFASFAAALLFSEPVERDALLVYEGAYSSIETVYHKKQRISHWMIYAKEDTAFRMLSSHGFDADAFVEKMRPGDGMTVLYEVDGMDVFEIRSGNEVIHSYEQSVDASTGNRMLGAGMMLAFAGYFAVTSAVYARKVRRR